ncbi:terminase, partial [Morganella morganii]
MSNISNLGDAYHWSVAKIAEAFGLNRGTVKKRLLDANVAIAGTVRGNPVYALRDVGPVIFGADTEK